MQVNINGEPEQIAREELTVTQLLDAKNVESPDMVSVQLNGEFIDRKNYPTTVINENDTVDFLYFMGGGSF